MVVAGKNKYHMNLLWEIMHSQYKRWFYEKINYDFNNNILNNEPGNTY